MKKLLILVLIATASVSAFAASRNNVSRKAVAQLQAAYPLATGITWTVKNDIAKATVFVNNESLSVFFNEFGERLGVSRTMAFDKLPKAALDIITTEYTFPDYQLTDCIAYTDAEGNTNYYASFETAGEELYISIDKNGNVSRY